MIYRLMATLMLIKALGLTSEIPPEEGARIELIAKQLETDQARTWPTLNWKETALIVTFENGHIFAFNLKSQNPNWEKLEIEHQQVLFASKDEWGLKELRLQPWFEIEGQEAFVYRMSSDETFVKDVTVFAHERFHRHQGEHFKLLGYPGVSRDHLNEENLTWAAIEDQLFREFLSAKTMDSLKDLLTVNQLRRSLLDPDTIAWENHQLKMEGLADYVSTKMFGEEAALLKMHPPSEGEEGFIDEAIKWRHYMAGASWGYALDFLLVKNWKQKIEAGAELTDLLSKSLPIDKTEQKIRIEALKKRLKYKKRRKKMAGKIAAYQQELADLYSSYEQKPGVKLFIDRPRASISGGGANERLYYLADGATVGVNDESMATTRDGHWSFSTYNVSHLFQHHDGYREVKVSDLKTIEIDHVVHAVDDILSEPREYLFTSLRIEGKEIALSSERHRGVLICEGDLLEIAYLVAEE